MFIPWVTSLLFAVFVGGVPFVRLAFLAAHMPVRQGYKNSPLTFWYEGHHMASLLMAGCDLIKPALTFMAISSYFHNDLIAFYAAFITALISFYWKPYHLQISYSPLPFLGFFLVLSPVVGGFLLGGYILLLFFLRRVRTTFIILCFLAPCFIVLGASAQTPYLLGFIFPLIMLFHFRKNVMRLYLLEEAKLPPLL